MKKVEKDWWLDAWRLMSILEFLFFIKHLSSLKHVVGTNMKPIYLNIKTDEKPK